MTVSRVDAFEPASEAAWNMSMFADLSDAISQQLKSASRLEDFEAGDIVLRGNEASCFIIVNGLVRIYLRGHDGRQVTIRYASQAEVVGMPPVVNRRMAVWGSAVTSGRMIRLPTTRLRTLAQRDVALAWVIARHLAEQMTTTNEVLSADIFLSVRGRVARHLLDLAERESAGLVVHARHQQIADAVGTVREVVSREMRRFVDEGLLARVPNGVVLLDPAALHRIGSGD